MNPTPLKRKWMILLILLSSLQIARAQKDIFERVEHHYADNEGVKIHYVSIGNGPVLVMLHGFPDYWYTWRYQMESLSNQYKVVGVDLRGYNLSDKPLGVENYAMSILMKDIIVVIDDLNVEKVTVVANDWGGAIAWQLATYYPNRIEKFIACNIPHPNGIRQYLDENPTTGEYAQNFKKHGAEDLLDVEGLVESHQDLNELDKARYSTAFTNSDFEAMLNYYRANYPGNSKLSQRDAITIAPDDKIKKVLCPVLMIYGMKDKALPPGMINNSWDWIDNELTIVTIPNAGHFIQQEANEKVTESIRWWLQHSN